MHPRLFPLLLLLPACRPAPAADGPVLRFEPPQVYGDRIRFQDELAPLVDALATLLAKPENGGFVVIPPATLRQQWADIQAGRLPGREGVCEGPPPADRLLKHLAPEAWTAELRIDCAGAVCKATLDLEAGKGGAAPPEGTALRHVAEFGAEQPVRVWVEQIGAGAFQPAEQVRSGVGFGGGGLGRAPGLYVDVKTEGAEGPWATRPNSALFQPQAQELLACKLPSWQPRDNWEQPVLIEVNPKGALTRCALRSPDHTPLDLEPGCLCKVLASTPYGPASGTRRAAVGIHVMEVSAPEERPRGYAYYRGTQADDPTAVLGSMVTDERAVWACLPQGQAALDLSVRFGVDAQGHTRTVDGDWPPSWTPEQLGCLKDTLALQRWNCPLSGQAQVTTTLRLQPRPGA